MAGGKRIMYFLGFLVVILPVITGLLVWQLMSKCETQGHDKGGQQTTHAYKSQTTGISFEDGPWMTLRLSKDVVPLHYEISLFPDFYENGQEFYGNATIQLNVRQATKVILMHVKYLNVSKTQLSKDKTFKDEIRIKRSFEYEPNEFWVIETANVLPSNETIYCRMEFGGSLTRSIVGFYKSTYFNTLTNASSAIATTKFEPVAARRAFPCMDEPEIKAYFSIELVHKANYSALSNMPIEEERPYSQSLITTKFQKSVKMSTYLVCFIVCDFKYLEVNTTLGTMVRLYAPSDRISQTKYALEVANTTVDLYTSMFNVSYPLPKLDLVSIPDFVSGAMENWGLITFRETNILFDENQGSVENKQDVAAVVAHEISHQWFGNLVTMEWWQDLWLNEGFATYMEYIGAAEHEPDWDMPDQFLVRDLQPVMVTDASLSSHPIVVDVQDPSQINAVFDSISYSKGASIIRMLAHWLGRDKFFKGLSDYLTEFRFQNAQTDNLWNKLGMFSANLSVKDVMDTWTKQMGLPYINITIDGDTVIATQHRFLADSAFISNPNTSSYRRYLWFIKLEYILKNGSSGNIWMEKTQSVSIDGMSLQNSNLSWIKFNINQTGFYRVNYPNSLWYRFYNQLTHSNHTAIGVADRSNLIDDAFNLARAGLVDYKVALNLTLYLSKEMDYLPWRSAQRGFEYISSMLEFTANHNVLKSYILKIVTPVFEKNIIWSDTGSHLQRRLRSILISLACGSGHVHCLKNASRLFDYWLVNGSIAPNLRPQVYKYGMIYSNSEDYWNRMWDRYLSEPVPQEKDKLMSALAEVQSVSLLIRYIELAKNESYIRSQDYFTVLSQIASNPIGRSLVWDWIRENWQYLVDRFTLYSRYFGLLIPSVVSNFNTQQKLKEVEAFFAQYPNAGAGENGRKQAIESIQRNINWMTENRDVVVNWLSQN